MVCRHSFEGKEGGNEVDRSGEAGVGLVVSSGDPAELLEPLEEVFDQVTPFVHLGVVRDRRFAVRLRRNDGQGARSLSVARKASWSNALSAMRASKSTPVISGSTPMLSCRWPGSRTKRDKLPSASTARRSWSSARRATCRWPDFESPFCAGAVPVNLDDRPVDERVFEIGIFRQRRENSLEHALDRPSAEALPHRGPLAERIREIAPWRPARTIHNTASMKRRLSSPDRRGSPSLPGKRGAIRAHWASFNSTRIKAGLQFSSLKIRSLRP